MFLSLYIQLTVVISRKSLVDCQTFKTSMFLEERRREQACQVVDRVFVSNELRAHLLLW